MIDLKDCTFIIPIRIESEDRMRNVITVLCHLLRNFDTKIILKEVDTESVFKKEVLPQIEEYLGDGINNLKHVFEKSDDPVFYRMKIINEMIDMVDTPIIANYDGDVVFKLETYTEAVEMIRGEYDIVYPYGFGNYQKQVFADDDLVSEFISNDFDFANQEDVYEIVAESNDHPTKKTLIRKDNFIDENMDSIPETYIGTVSEKRLAGLGKKRAFSFY